MSASASKDLRVPTSAYGSGGATAGISKPLSAADSARVVESIANALSSLKRADFLLCSKGDAEAPEVAAGQEEIARIKALLARWQPARFL